MVKNLKYWIGFSFFPQIGSIRFKKIYQYFSSLEEAWQAPLEELKKCGLEEKIAQDFVLKRKTINLDLEWEKLNKEKVKVVTIFDKEYPKLLKEIYNPPFLLYYKGIISEEDKFSLAVVGTRKPSIYGQEVTQYLVSQLSANKITIVSGLALGIDSLAHKTAIKEKGRTVAVLGNGLDRIYPVSNKKLAERIINSFGAIFSEYPLGTPPLKHHFPYRNRIISGLSLGTLVIEAGRESGALITAKYALEQNREVFAVPGNIFHQTSQGTNNLIKLGAKAVTRASDILDELNLNQVSKFIENKKIIPATKEEEIILKFLSKEPIHIDKLAQLSNLDIATVNSTLILMEMKGKVKNLGANNYIINF